MGYEDGTAAPYACTGGLGPGSGLGLGCANGNFGSGFGGNVNGNSNDNILVGAKVSCSSFLGRIQSGSCSSNLLLMRQDIYEYDNGSDTLRSNLNSDCVADPPRKDELDSLEGSGLYQRRRLRLLWVHQLRQSQQKQRRGNGRILP